MANNVTNDRYWILDTVAEIIGNGTGIRVQKLVLIPNAAGDSATIQEYVSGALAQAAYIKAPAGGADMVELDFGPEGRYFNGFKLSAITAGTDKLHVYLRPA